MKLLKNLGVSLISLLLFILIAEALSRIAYSPQKVTFKGVAEYDKEKKFRLKKSYRGPFSGQEIVTNSFGYRDSEIPIKKGARTFRVLLIVVCSITCVITDLLRQEIP